MLLSDLTTLRLGGPCEDVVPARTEEVLLDAVRTADAARTPLLLLSGGSNVVIGDAGFTGRTVLVRTSGVRLDGDIVEVAAGEPWAGFVSRMVAGGRSGVEALAGIPGAVGSTPIQNVGAYGQEVAETIVAVRVWDRVDGCAVRLTNADCAFGYRHSRFKSEPGRFVVLAVTFRLPETGLSAPVRYAELARRLDVEVGARIAVADVESAVLGLRRDKGMVLDPADHDTWSAGSFFTNPIIDAALVPAGAPAYPAADGLVKTSAAWLIDHAGFAKGYRVDPKSRAGLSTKHALALTNRGNATTADLLQLARTVRAGVHSAYGIELVPEPVLVSCAM